ncbi:MAG TPA: 3-oxoacyl-ACP synthase [Flavobacteriales bacterium]|nr:3-oxoacyl-ACP synthase [Flavobacteriales bacterium]HRE75084.1 beta-ketoacyl-ACP synthase III [Flavobacteriales bacterium]HRJ36112.1 beta-ketoacyl-ACP synthase III [Flavobacteriales bacterium]HRJ39213.1 beta-ketoacyl-ACP synthase III [Flavobacteriales bacterium]
MAKAAITAVGGYVPEYVLTNEEIETMMDTTSEWIVTRSGITERRIMKDKTKASAFMAAEAAKEVLKKSGTSAKDIELIIVATVTPDHQYPATANIVADMIGATNAWSFDVQAACSSFIYALQTASKFIESGAHKKVIVIGSDKMSSIMDYTDRSTSILFGDGAGAVLLEPSADETGILDARMYVDGSGKKYLYQEAGGSLQPASFETVLNKQHFVTMEGQSVFKVAVVKMADVAEEIMVRNKLGANDIAFLVPHQANKRIIEATADRMGVGMEKVMLNIQRYGNTTSATLPLCLWEWEKQLKKGDNLILTTFGAGFTWGGMLVRWSY